MYLYNDVKYLVAIFLFATHINIDILSLQVLLMAMDNIIIDSPREKLRILVCDDEKEILSFFKMVLDPGDKHIDNVSDLGGLEEDLFGDSEQRSYDSAYDVSCFRRGDEGLVAVQEGYSNGRPFAVAFIDVRMPPGPDGITTAEEIRKIDPFITIVMVTAYEDIDPVAISAQVPPVDKILYLQKPLHIQEIRQFSSSLGEKWLVERRLAAINDELDERVRLRTAELAHVNNALEKEIQEKTSTAEALRISEEELRNKSQDLQESNIALKVLLRQRETDKEEIAAELKTIEENMVFNVNDITIPFLDKLAGTKLNEQQREYIDILRTNLEDIVAPILLKVTGDALKFTPSELHIANLIKQGKTTKEIASLLNLGIRTIEFHRANIRKKLKITNEGENLKTVLLSLSAS